MEPIPKVANSSAAGQQSRRRKAATAMSIPFVGGNGGGRGENASAQQQPSPSRRKIQRTMPNTTVIATTATSSKSVGTPAPRRGNSSGARNSPVPIPVMSSTTTTSNSSMKERFLNVFTLPDYQNGIANSALKEMFGETDYISLAPVINELIGQSRLTMSKINTPNISTFSSGATTELYYQLVSNEIAAKFYGLDVAARLVYQVIERAGNLGIWTKDIRIQTNIQQQALNKIFKLLESRQLIKPVKSVAAKSKKLYMIYNLTPSKELTGGIWYSDLEFDHEFINELRIFLLQCIKRMNNGNGITLQQIIDKIHMAQISRVELSSNDVLQLIQTLIYDYMVEEITTSSSSDNSNTVYVAARKVTPLCEFNWWEILDNDFQYRNIRFEDNITLSAQELHYHS